MLISQRSVVTEEVQLVATSTEFTFVIGAGYQLPVGSNVYLDFNGTFNLMSDFNNVPIMGWCKIWVVIINWRDKSNWMSIEVISKSLLGNQLFNRIN